MEPRLLRVLWRENPRLRTLAWGSHSMLPSALMNTSRIALSAFVLATLSACGVDVTREQTPLARTQALRVSAALYQEDPAAFRIEMNGRAEGTLKIQRCLPDTGCEDQYLLSCETSVCTVKEGDGRAFSGNLRMENTFKDGVGVIAVALCNRNLRGQPAQAKFQVVPPAGDAHAAIMRSEAFFDVARCNAL